MSNTDDKRIPVVKAQLASTSDVDKPSAKTDEVHDTLSNIVSKKQLLEPPYAPAKMIQIVENSSSLNQNIEAYMTNIDGLGHRLESVFDFEGADIIEQVRDAIWVGSGQEGAMLSDDEVAEHIKDLKTQARLEEVKLNNFFEYINPDGSFTSLRRQTRQHLETTGNAYWEILRTKKGVVSRAMLVPTSHVRLLAQDKEPLAIKDEVPAGPLHTDVVTQYRFFRRFVQLVGRDVVYFKEFGDPRVVSRATGMIYKDMKEFEAAREKANMTEDEDRPATEMLHFKLSRPGYAYGVPRWVGVLLAALGSRAADEVNFNYFDNKTIPPLALLVQGGRLGADDVSKIETYLRDHIKGRSNFHKILVLEANVETAQQLAGVTTLPKIEFKPLTETQLNDGQFQKYDERNIDKIGSAFRLPRLMRGDVRDFNRSTALASLRFAEEQVFEPERKEFDAFINRKLLPELGIKLWRFKTAGNRTRDPDIISEIVDRLVKSNVLTINEAREILSDALGTAISTLPYDWAKQPLELTLAGFSPSNPTDERDEDADLDDLDALANEANRLADEQNSALDVAREKSVQFLKDGVREEQEHLQKEYHG